MSKSIENINVKIERVMDEIESLEVFLESYKKSGKSTENLKKSIGLKYMGLQSLLNEKDRILSEKKHIKQMINEEQELFKRFNEEFSKSSEGFNPFQNLTPKDIVDSIGRGFDPNKVIAKEKFNKVMSKDNEFPLEDICPVCKNHEEKLIINLQNSLKEYLLFQLEKEREKMLESVEIKINEKRKRILKEIAKGINISLV